jgi:hypothetical protein
LAIIVVRTREYRVRPGRDMGGVCSVMLPTRASHSQSRVFRFDAVMSPTVELSAAHADVMTARRTIRLNA